MADSIDDLEQECGSALDAAYPELWPVTNAVRLAVQELFGSMPPLRMSDAQESNEVSRNLLARIITDIYGLSTLAWRGYPLQAGTLAATTFELCFTLSFIGTDNERATRWLEHNDPKNPFIDAFSAIRNSVARALGPQATPAQVEVETRTEHEVYRNLSMIKHGNPIAQQEYGVHWGAESALIRVGPQPGTRFQVLTLYIMWHTLRNIVWAADVFAMNYVEGPAFNSWRDALSTIRTQLHELRNHLQTQP